MQRSKKAASNPLLPLFTLLWLPHRWHFTFLPALIVTLLLMVIEYVTNENLLTPYWFFTKRQTFLFWLNAFLCAFSIVKSGIIVSHENRNKIATAKTYISVSFCRAGILAVYVTLKKKVEPPYDYTWWDSPIFSIVYLKQTKKYYLNA